MGKTFHFVSFRKLKETVNDQIIERKINSKARGPHAETFVKWKLLEKGWNSVKGPEGAPVDLLTMSMEYPLRVVPIQVKSLYIDNSSIHISVKNFMQESGPLYIIVVETKRGNFECLILSHYEMDKQLWKLGRDYKKDIYLTIPKSLEGYEFAKEKWEKVLEASKIFGDENKPV